MPAFILMNNNIAHPPAKDRLKEAKKILVINLRYIGDTVWMYPFMRNLKLNIPEGEITAMVNEGGDVFLKLLPEVSEVITVPRKEIKGRFGIIRFIRFLIEIRRKKFDTVFILSSSDRPTIIGFASGAKKRIGFEGDGWWRKYLLTERLKWDRWDAETKPHVIEYYLQALIDSGLRIYDSRLTIDVPESAIKGITERFGILKRRDKKTIIVHPGARTEQRQWGAEKFAAVINAVGGDYRIFLIGGPQEGGVVQQVLKKLNRTPDIVCNELSLLEFAALCKFADLFVGNDSSPIHIAAATGLYVVGIYGPTLSKYCGPWTHRRALFDLSTLPCRMCRQDGCINEEEKACLDIVKPEMIIDTIREVSGKCISE
jgi:lipopolysaccharide heptosyltransferase II